MDWLTEEWASDTGNQAMMGWWDSDGKRDMGAFVADFIARAAARKLVKWAEIKATQLSAARTRIDGGPTEGGSEYSLGIDALLESIKAAIEASC